jgi:hypothetical protein
VGEDERAEPPELEERRGDAQGEGVLAEVDGAPQGQLRLSPGDRLSHPACAIYRGGLHCIGSSSPRNGSRKTRGAEERHPSVRVLSPPRTLPWRASIRRVASDFAPPGSGGAAPWLERLFRVRTERRNHVLLPLLRTQEHETIVDYARDQRSRPLSGEEQSTK